MSGGLWVQLRSRGANSKNVNGMPESFQISEPVVTLGTCVSMIHFANVTSEHFFRDALGVKAGECRVFRSKISRGQETPASE